MEYQSVQALEELSAFVAVVESQGFTAAARATQGRKATLSKRVQDLEARLGVPLLVRTTRSLRLTDEGRAYFEHARRSLASARDAEAVVLSAKSKPHGLLRITTTSILATSLVDRVIHAYLEKYPEVGVYLDTSARRIDILREGFDLAIRVGPLEDSSLVARWLGVSNGGFYASPRYLAKRKVPARPEDVAAHDTIVVPKGDHSVKWAFAVGGKPKYVSVRPRFWVTDLDLAARTAAAGFGIVQAPLQVAQSYLAEKKLVQILRDFTPEGREVHALFPPGGALVPKTRLFVDMLQGWFRESMS